MPTRFTMHASLLAAATAIGTAVNAPALAGSQQQESVGQAANADRERIRTTTEWNLPKRTTLAIGGYDPVAYFPEGGGKATKGSKSFEHVHKGVTYRFASRANLERFKKAPDRYEPAHGLWCSWAMTNGEKTEPNPKRFIVKDDRLFLFYDGFFGNTRSQWLKGDHDDLAEKADREWKKISREDKRQVAKPAG